MKNDTEIEDSNSYNINWLETSIAEGHINYYEYSDFKDIHKVEENIFRATWKNIDLFVTLKSFNNRTLTQKVVNEIKLRKKFKKFDIHPNVLKFYGITKIKTDYSLVLEYADSDTLKTYLSDHFGELDWNDKCHLALQLSSAVEFMHECGINLRDLHSNNILVHQKNIKLDFGLPKHNDKMFAYIDPKSLNNQDYELNEKSDVYSIGILMWQISSGRQPFCNERVDNIDIIQGKREEIVGGTPIEYSDLYQECWEYEPNERPDLKEIILTLRAIDSCGKSENSSNLQDPSEESTFDSISSIIIDMLIKKHNEGFTFEQVKKFIKFLIKDKQKISKLGHSPSEIASWLLNNQVKSKYIWFLGLFYYYDIYNIGDNNKAFESFSKAADNNYSIAQIYLAKCYIDGCGTEKNKNLAFNFYQKAVENGSIIGQFYLGYCYEYGIGVKKNEAESISWYKKATDNGNTTAKLYLANSYRLGKGVGKDETKAFKYYERLALQEISDAQNQFGNCYYNGIGTNKNKKLAKRWYERAASNGDIVAKDTLKTRYNTKVREIKLRKMFKRIKRIRSFYYTKNLMKNHNEEALHKAAQNGHKEAQFRLAGLYRTGNCEAKDERKAFKYYKKSAKQGYLDAKVELGYCYDKGIGVEINKVNAYGLYKVAAEKENSRAQNYLGLLYENGQGVKRNYKKAFKWYKKAEENGNEVARCNLARSYQFGIGIAKDENKAFNLYKQVADKKEYKNAIFQLGYCYELGKGVDKDDNKAFRLYQEAANEGFIEASYKLGKCYNNGIGTVIDRERAFRLYEKAAKEGFIEALYKLGECYKNGIGTVINKERAFKLYEEAAEKGSVEAQYELGNCYNNGIGTEINKERAFEFYKKASDEGNDEAQYELGNCHNNGIGTVINKEKAFEFYEKASVEGNIKAQKSLASLYEGGEGTKRDLELAFFWHQKSTKNEKFQIIKKNQLNITKTIEGTNVSLATMLSNDDKVAIKRLKNAEGCLLLQNIAKWSDVYNDLNIVEFLGISVKDEDPALIMPFANDGNLRDYYKDHKDKLTFNKKIEIAKNVAKGIRILHNNSIVHGNLNPENILIFNGIAKISNLLPLPCNSKGEVPYFDGSLFDKIGYIDPLLLSGEHKISKSTDIYSFGTLLWEIMSEKVPYSKDQDIINLIRLFNKGYREDDISDVSAEYLSLYKDCWDGNSSNRPSIDDVCNRLSNIKY